MFDAGEDQADDLDDGGLGSWADEADAVPLPSSWGRPRATIEPSFASLHGAYHVLTQRLDLDLRDHATSSTEAVVLCAIRHRPLEPIATIRHVTGLRRSTLSSVLDRLEDRGWLRRIPDRHDERFVELRLTPAGETAAAIAEDALRDLDAELAVFVRRDVLGAPAAIFEATRALGVPGTAADI